MARFTDDGTPFKIETTQHSDFGPAGSRPQAFNSYGNRYFSRKKDQRARVPETRPLASGSGVQLHDATIMLFVAVFGRDVTDRKNAR